ncbi:preprotein translocase subunit YajC [Leucobacter sp. 1207-22]
MRVDPISIVMFGLIAVLIFFMFRNGKKRQAAAQEMQNNMRPGAEVMLSSGIYATIDSIDEESNKVTVTSGTTTLVVHRQAVSQIVTPNEAAVADDAESELAPDDDPAFGERIESTEAAPSETTEKNSDNDDSADQAK